MFSPARKWSLLLLVMAFITAGCEKPAPFKVKDRSPRADSDAPFDPPETYPEWAFDQPQYARPVAELTPEPKAKAGDPLHYFTKEKVVLIRQPSGYTPEEIPRIAVWWSDNNGFHWQKAGFFGRQQAYFAFEAAEDGDYGIRFVGPGQEQAIHATAYPERVYHVDTTFPEVEVTIDPEQTWYNAGQSITISWAAEDYHLIETPVNVTALLDFSAEESKPIEVQKNLAKEGSITYKIPQEALNHEIRFRVDAMDRGTNLGIAYSHALQIVSEPVEPGEAKPKEASLPEQVSLKKDDISRAFAQTKPQPIATQQPEPVVIEQVASNGPAKPLGAEEIIEEDIAPSAPKAGESKLAVDTAPRSAKPHSLPYATDMARSPTKRPTQTVVAISPDSPEDTTAAEYNLAEPLPAGDIREVTPQESGGYTPIEPIDSNAKSTGQPLSMNRSATPNCEDEELAIMTLRDGSPDDVTHGNRLLIPMPATVSVQNAAPRVAMAHPWRLLGRAADTTIRTVWMLPQARFMELNPVLRNLFLADRQSRPVGEPAKGESSLAGLPSDSANVDPTP
ncbi:MAG: hypothetical protein AABZ08_10810 [Planctomycetota bacterium]